MGVKDLWSVASPCEERISLHELRGMTLAIDLAGWVVQNQTVANLNYRVTRPHLRNLMFRTQTLLGLDILPVFVLDGQPPKIKSATVAARNQQTWGHHRQQNKLSVPTQVSEFHQSPKIQKRKQFTGILKECGQLLDSLGVAVVRAPGEAEAYCALLDRCGLVNGVLSDDSDSLCYGAKTVYRHFSTDPKNFSVSKYAAKRLRTELGLSRERIVVMALLLGCDYTPGGVNGIGKEIVLKLFKYWGDPQRGELQKVIEWRSGEDEEDAEAIKKPSHCGTCGHPGSLGQHRKTGCSECPGGSCKPDSLPCPCFYHSPVNQQRIVETSIRRKALESPGWPHQKVVQEFYGLDSQKLSQSFKWACPTPSAFVQLCVDRMDWAVDYAKEKIQTIISRWQAQNPGQVSGVSPVRVIKTRVVSGENMVMVEWDASLIPCLPNPFTACVPTADFEKSYPRIMEEYIQFKESKKKKPKKAKENKDPGTKEGNSKKQEKQPAKKGLQPSIKQFLEAKGPTKKAEEDKGLSASLEDLVQGFNESLDLRPKNVLLKKTVYTSMTVVKEVKLVDRPLQTSTKNEVEAKDSQEDEFPVGGALNLTRRLDDSDIQQYLEETYNSEMSGILDEILGCDRDSSDDEEKSPDDLCCKFSVNDASPATGAIMTSTPDIGRHTAAETAVSAAVGLQRSPSHNSRDRDSCTGSPWLKSITTGTKSVTGPKLLTGTRANKGTTSVAGAKSVPTGAKSVTGAKSQSNQGQEVQKNPGKPEADNADTSGDDEFDIDISSCTPLIDRVKRRLAK